MRFGRRSVRWLAVAATALLQACANGPPPAPAARIFAADIAGGAKTCVVPKVTPAPGRQTPVEVKVGNDGGWCGITVNDGGKPYSAGLLVSEPEHGQVLIHSVGDNTRIDYTPAPRFAGADSFTVRLIPGDATLRASVSVGSS